MKATIEFDLNEEKDEFQNALNGSKYEAKLNRIADLFRRYRKYVDMNEEQAKIFNAIQKEYFEIIQDLS